MSESNKQDINAPEKSCAEVREREAMIIAFGVYLRAELRSHLFGDRSELPFADQLKKLGADIAKIRAIVEADRSLLVGEMLNGGLSWAKLEEYIGRPL
jgi:hypothetical protein